MLLDDDLYPSSTIPFSPSQAPFAASPNPAESDGYRITWGPSAGSILADISKLRNNAVSSVKRTSANAGLASPTRQGAAGFSGASLVNNTIQPLRNWVPQQQPQLASNNSKQDDASTSKATAARRFSKRRRRYPSGSILATDCDRVGSSSSTMEIDDSTLNPSTLSLIDELQKRLEAKRAAAQAEREAELAMEKEKENNVKRQHSRKHAEESRDKGKGKSKLCSPILELSERSHSNQSQQQAKDASSISSSSKGRQVLQPKQDNSTSRPSSQQSNGPTSVQGKLLPQNHRHQPLDSTPKKALKADTYRIPSQPVPSSPAGESIVQLPGKRHGLERKTSSSTSVVPDSQEAPVSLTAGSSKNVNVKGGVKKSEKENDDMGDYWNDEEDKSLEMEMSQMTIPAVPASQTSASQAARPAVKSADNVNNSKGSTEERTWGGFQRRDKRLGNAASNTNLDERQDKQEEEPKKSSGGLSTKPLAKVLVSAKPVKPAAVPQKAVPAQVPTAKAKPAGVASTTSLKAAANVPANPPAPVVKKAVSAPVMQPTSNKTTSSVTVSRVLGSTTAPCGLAKTPSDTRFKPPSIVNKEKSEAEKVKFHKTVGVVQNYPGDDLGLDSIDFDNDNDSF